MALSDSRFILKRNFVVNLAAAMNDENSPAARNYCSLTYGSTSYWAPVGVV